MEDEEEESFDEIPEEEIAVPKPQYKKPIQQVQAKPIQTPQPQVEGWRVEEYPTATQPVIYNSKTKKIYTFYEALAELLNRTEQ
jgi:hypothetical protein